MSKSHNVNSEAPKPVFRASNIHKVKRVSTHELKGTNGGAKIRVRRRIDGWSVKLEIVVNGVLIHSDVANEAEKAEFEALGAKAYSRASDRWDAKRAYGVDVLNLLAEE